MRGMLVRTCLGLAFAGLSLCAPSVARAEFSPIRLVSQNPAEQAQRAEGSALSADGKFLAFQGEIGGQEGIFREELGSGLIVPVYTEPTESGRTPREPSISANGRHVSFTTSARLDPDDDENDSDDVYVADLSSTPPTYELASALTKCDPNDLASHSACGLTYEATSAEAGAEASGRVALSADGRKVVFITAASSDLGGAPGDTPAGEVVLRDLETHVTTVVSVERDPLSGEMTDRPVAGGTELEGVRLAGFRGASLSADGTTVAWLGTNLPAQVPLLADEQEAISQFDASDTPYDEPLWRRVADGAKAPTRRIVGGGDPVAPGCSVKGSLAEVACQGPFLHLLEAKPEIDQASRGWLGPSEVQDAVPQLSADGRTVALIGNPNGSTNVFVADMRDGLTRKESVRQLTREVIVNSANPNSGIVGSPNNTPLNGLIFDSAVSPGGQRIAFTTARQRFPLAPPNLITAPPAQLGLLEIYSIDLEDETLQRVTHGFEEGEPSLNSGFVPIQSAPQGVGASSPSFDASGHLLAFTSVASNLVPGDGNDANDAFVVEDDEAPRGPSQSLISAGPKLRRLKRPKGIMLSASSLPDGSVKIRAVVPSAGALRARAHGSLAAGGKSRPLATASDRIRKPEGGTLRLTLSLPGGLRRLAHRREGVYAIAEVNFHRHHGRGLHGRIQVRFHAHRRQRGPR